jgi:hypothetical protein
MKCQTCWFAADPAVSMPGRTMEEAVRDCTYPARLLSSFSIWFFSPGKEIRRYSLYLELVIFSPQLHTLLHTRSVLILSSFYVYIFKGLSSLAIFGTNILSIIFLPSLLLFHSFRLFHFASFKHRNNFMQRVRVMRLGITHSSPLSFTPLPYDHIIPLGLTRVR